MPLPFSKFEDFAGLVRHNGIEMKPTLLRVLTDFYVQKPTHTAQEDRHFTELALRLIDDVDAGARAAAAKKLMDYGSAPGAVMERLLRAVIPAHPESYTVEHPLEEIFESEAATEAPASLPRTSHEPTIDSDRAAAAHFSDLFFAANSGARLAMLRQLEAGAAVPPALSRSDAAAAISRLEAAALKARPFEFVREIEQTLGIPRVYSEKIVTDASGEPMLIVAKALGMPSDVLQRILLLVNPAIGTSVRRVFDLSDLYENLAPQSALRLMMLWRYAGPAKTAHQAVQPSPAEDHRKTPQRQAVPAFKKDQRAS